MRINSCSNNIRFGTSCHAPSLSKTISTAEKFVFHPKPAKKDGSAYFRRLNLLKELESRLNLSNADKKTTAAIRSID